MRTVSLALIFISVAGASEFHSGQAARAVIGQPSFSARETGVSAHALSLDPGHLYAAEENRLLKFDLAKIPSAKEAQGALLGLAPISIVSQSVMPGVSGIAVLGRVVVAADAVNHHVLIWRSNLPVPGLIGPKLPDVTLDIADPVSVAYDGRHLFVGDASRHRVLIWNGLPSSNGQSAGIALGQADLFSGKESNTLDAATIGMPAALVSDGTNLFVSDIENRRILVFSPGDISLTADAILNSASLQPGALAPGMLINIRATGISQDSEAAEATDGSSLPTRLAEVEVYLNDMPLPLLSVSPTEIAAQLPFDLGTSGTGSLYLRSFRANGSVLVSNPTAVHFAPVSPGIFAFGSREPRNGLLLHGGGQRRPDGAPAKGTPITADTPATPGEVITIWASGLGAVNSGDGRFNDRDTVLQVRARVNGEPADVLSARLPRGAVGVYEVAVALPPNIPVSDRIHLQLVQNAVTSNTVVFPVQQAH